MLWPTFRPAHFKHFVFWNACLTLFRYHLSEFLRTIKTRVVQNTLFHICCECTTITMFTHGKIVVISSLWTVHNSVADSKAWFEWQHVAKYTAPRLATGQMNSSQYCRIHHVTASMTTIDLIIKPRTGLFDSVTTLFKLVAFKLYTVFQSVLPLLLFSSYPLPTLTMHHIPFSKCGGLWTFVYPPYMHNMRWRPRFCTGWSDPDNSVRSLVTIAIQHRSVDPSIVVSAYLIMIVW